MNRADTSGRYDDKEETKSANTEPRRAVAQEKAGMAN